MEIIKKIISLEPFKSRLPGLLKPLNGEVDNDGNWGLFIGDINFSTVNGLGFLGILSYRTMIDRYYWLSNLYKNTQFLVCKNVNTNNNYMWIQCEVDDYHDVYITSNLPTPNAESEGMVVGVISESDEVKYNNYGGLIFYNFVERSLGRIKIPQAIKKIFTPQYIYMVELEEWVNKLLLYKKSSDCCLNERYKNLGGDNLLNYFNDILNNTPLYKEISYFETLSENKSSIQLPLMITHDFDDMGMFTPLISEWVPGQRYYVNESNVSGDMVIYQEDIYKLIKGYETLDYYDGFYSEKDGLIYFDDLSEDGKSLILNHWEKCVPNIQDKTIIISETESQLQSLRRITVSYDDNGVELPGILKLKEVTNDGTRVYEDELDLLFEKNLALNISTTLNNEGLLEYKGDMVYDILYTENTVTLRYVIGAILEIKREVLDDVVIETLVYDVEKNDTGVRYEDVYYYQNNSISLEIDGNPSKLYNYKDIDFIGGTVNIIMSDVNNIERKVNISETSYYNDNKEEVFIEVPIIKEEYLMGISSPSKIKSDIFIDRGISSAFERHIKLSEIHTLSDMEEYANSSFFKMK